jgi:hypothetical protein
MTAATMIGTMITATTMVETLQTNVKEVAQSQNQPTTFNEWMSSLFTHQRYCQM